MNKTNLEAIIDSIIGITHETLAKFEQTRIVTTKSDNSFVTDADIELQRALIEFLTNQDSNYQFIGEESLVDESDAALGNQQTWVIDPIDGTTNFANKLPFFATSLVLLENKLPQCGITYDPSRKECFYAIRGQGAWINGQSIKTNQDHLQLSTATAIVDLKTLPEPKKSTLMFNQPFKSHRHFGATTLEWCWVACNRAQIFMAGEKALWDSGAGHLILQEAGGYSSDLDNKAFTPCSINKKTILATANKSLHDQLLSHFNSDKRH